MKATTQKQVAFIGGDEDRQKIVAQVKKVMNSARSLLQALSECCPGRAVGVPRKPSKKPRNKSTKTPGIVGALNGCLRFIDKSAHDLPLMRGKGCSLPTPLEAGTIREQLTKLDATLKTVLHAHGSKE